MAYDEQNVFAKILRGEAPAHVVCEDEHTLAFMDINPASEGHALVVPKEHWEDLYAISERSLAAVALTARNVARAVGSVVSPDGLNLVQCNGPAAAQSVLHFHMHVLPRTSGDELKLNWGLKPGDMDRIKALSEQIAAAV